MPVGSTVRISCETRPMTSPSDPWASRAGRLAIRYGVILATCKLMSIFSPTTLPRFLARSPGQPGAVADGPWASSPEDDPVQGFWPRGERASRLCPLDVPPDTWYSVPLARDSVCTEWTPRTPCPRRPPVRLPCCLCVFLARHRDAGNVEEAKRRRGAFAPSSSRRMTKLNRGEMPQPAPCGSGHQPRPQPTSSSQNPKRGSEGCAFPNRPVKHPPLQSAKTKAGRHAELPPTAAEREGAGFAELRA